MFDAKGMRQNSVFWYLKTALNSVNKNQNKLVSVKEGLYKSIENGIKKLSLGQTFKTRHPICCSTHLYPICSYQSQKEAWVSHDSILSAKELWWRCRSNFVQRITTVTDLKKTFSQLLQVLSFPFLYLGSALLTIKNISFHKQTVFKNLLIFSSIIYSLNFFLNVFPGYSLF